MAEMLVESTKLNACLDAEADAIRAKTGGSADIPFDYANNKGFADAIQGINGYFLSSEANLLSGVSWENGFIGGTNTPMTATVPNREIRFDFIDVTPSTTYYFAILVPNVVEQWVGLCWYDSSDAFIKRDQPMNSVGMNKKNAYQQFFCAATSNAAKIRITLRSL